MAEALARERKYLNSPGRGGAEIGVFHTFGLGAGRRGNSVQFKIPSLFRKSIIFRVERGFLGYNPRKFGWQRKEFRISMKAALGRLMRLSIGKKLQLGFLSYGVLTVVIALYALANFERLNEINSSIVQRDIPLIEITDRMVETLLAQELYAQRSIILRSKDMRALFWKRGQEFRQLVAEMKTLPPPEGISLERLLSLHEEYAQMNQMEFESRKSPSFSPPAEDRQIQAKQEEILQLVRKIAYQARHDQQEKNRIISEMGERAFRVTAGICIAAVLLGVFIALVISRNISGPLNQLKLSTAAISEGKFDQLPQVQTRDELGDLSKAFQEMALRVKELEEMYLDANPLTRLPGGVAIEVVLKERLSDDSPMAFCLADLRHFKAFNDRYGYARGNEVILATAQIISQAVKEHGKEKDFVGHVGGDDFVLVTTPDRYEKICSSIIDSFDRRILEFYDPEDKERGYIQGKTRRGQVVSFPIMTIALAVVTNQHRKLKSHIQVGEIAAEMKNFAKTFSKSIFVVDKRRAPPYEWAPEGKPRME